MGKKWKPGKQTVEMRPSKIRREPMPADKPTIAGKIRWDSREWEIRLAIAGITFFALALSALVIDFGEVLSR